MDSDGMFNLGGLEAAPGELSTPCLSPFLASFLPLSCSPPFLYTSYSLVTHLVWVDGHAGGKPDHRDAVKARRVRDRRWSEVVIGLGRVTHQDGIDLQRRGERALSHSDTGSKKNWQQPQFQLKHFLSFFFLSLEFCRFGDQSEQQYLFSLSSTLLYNQYQRCGNANWWWWLLQLHMQSLKLWSTVLIT